MKKIAKLSILLILIAATINIASADSFPNALRDCRPYIGTFIHPFFGQKMTRQILNSPGNVCRYHEQMPNTMSMRCNYPKSILPSISQYYADTQSAKTTGTDMSTNGQKKYTINGRQVSNPIQEALDRGYCSIQ